MVPQPSYLRTAGPSTPGCGPLSPCGHSQARGMCVGRGWWPAQVRGSGQLECQTPPLLNLPSETRRTGPSGFSATTQWAPHSLSAHRYGRWREPARRGQTGRPGGSSQWGGVVPSLRLLPPRSVQGRLPGRGAAHDPRLGHLKVLFSPLHFPSTVTMSLTTRWLSCRNGTTKALVLCSGGQR